MSKQRNKMIADEHNSDKSAGRALAETVTSPECLSASVLTLCQGIDHSHVTELVGELKKQSAAIHVDDLSRAEGMLSAQAHTLDGLFAKLTGDALKSSNLDKLERYMKLALKAQNQARATVQTIVELKAPKKYAFVQQANIGGQVQVNNQREPTRTGEKRNAPNELMEEHHGEWMDTRASGTAGRTNPAMATLGEKHGAKER